MVALLGFIADAKLIAFRMLVRTHSFDCKKYLLNIIHNYKAALTLLILTGFVSVVGRFYGLLYYLLPLNAIRK